MVKNLRSQKGAALVEYALLVALIALVVFTLVRGVGNNVKGIFEQAQTDIKKQ